MIKHLTEPTRQRQNIRMTKVAELFNPAVVASAVDEPEAFRHVVESHSHRLFRLAYRMTGHTQDAEDLVQETFLRAYRARTQFDARASITTWLYRICVNATLDQIRRRKTQGPTLTLDDPESSPAVPQIPSPSASPERLTLSHELRRQLELAMAELSATERAAFALRHYEQQSIAEIGAALGLSEAAAKNTIFRGVRKLRRALAPLLEVGQ